MAPPIRRLRFWLLVVFASPCVALAAGVAHGQSGAPCEPVPFRPAEVDEAVKAGVQLFAHLEASAAQVAIVARVGSDQSKRGIRYTHAGLSWRDHPQGRWHLVHLLNHCGSETSELFDDGPVNFFLERPFSYDSLVLIPTPEVQARVVDLLREASIRELHEPRYSAIANPFETRFQNSNQWLLELFAAALDPDHGLSTRPLERERSQRFLASHGYRPERVRLGFFERVGARRRDNVSLSDHRRKELREGGYLWVSVKSIRRFLDAEGWLLSVVELRADA